MVVLLIGFFLFAGLYTDALWYTQLGFQNVLYTEWLTIASLFVVGFVAMAVPVAVTIQLAYRLRPVYAKLTAQLDRYQQVIEPLRRVVMIGLPALIGVFAGVSAAARWQSILLLLHGGTVGTKDPQFKMDIGFYLFALPALHGIVGFASAVLVICGLAAIATSYLYGAIRVAGREVRVSRPARVQIAVTVAVFLVLQAVSLYLDQFTTLYSESTVPNVTGGVFADVNAVIPGRVILAVIALLVALLFVVTAAIGRWRLPLIGSAILVVASIVVGSILPWAMYNLYVKPSEASLERPFIDRAIRATRAAYGVSGVQTKPYDAKTTAEAGALRQDASTTANIRIIDPSVVPQAFTQFQGFKQYYKFAPQTQSLDVDRYTIKGTTQDAVVGVRELYQAGLTSPTAFNNTFVYTHGYGLVAAYGNQRQDDGAPSFFESNIPTSGDLQIKQPRIYFGENSPRFSIVGAPSGAKPIELDYATGSGAGGTQVNNTYDGDGGPSVGNFFNRLVYSIKFSSDQILLSTTGVNSRSQILYDRNPITRVQKVAPYLTTDQDPYPSVVDGRIVWIVDGFTTSTTYPYSSLQSLSGALANSNSAVAPYATDQINYIRNSVKATVDAYSGKVTLYAWDTQDPLLRAWTRVFPASVRPLSDMTGELMSHVRYPEDLFRVQRAILGRYHVQDAASWYTSDDQWQPPQDPTPSGGSGDGAAADAGSTTATEGDRYQPPYYLTMRLPDQDAPSFSLYSTYIPAQNAQGSAQSGRLTGYLAVDSNAGSTSGVKRAGYGELRLLELPSDRVVQGPSQVQTQITSDAVAAPQINLLNRGNTTVEYGNLLTIPIGGGLLYVEPVYVRSNAGSPYPLLRKVLTAFGDKVAFEDTLSQSLDALFGGDSGTTTPDSGAGQPSNGGTGGGSGGSGGAKATISPALRTALNDAQAALRKRQQAYADNNLVAAAQADQELQDALERAAKAAG